MKILVSGSSGRIGSAIAKSLAVRHSVVGVDRVSGSDTTHVLDLLSDELEPLLDSVDAIIHCAALHAPHISQHSERAFWDANVETTRRLLSFSSPATAFILTSTTSVFGDAMTGSSQTVWIEEGVRPQPRDIYDVTKLAAEDLLRESSNSGRASTVLRISRCFPEPEPCMAVYRMHRGVDVRDVVQAHELALLRTGGLEAFIISGPTKFQYQDIPALSQNAWLCIEGYYPQAAEVFTRKKWKKPNFIDRVYSSAKAYRELNYRPRYGIDEFLDGNCDPKPLP